ncbi:peptide/nickel transport system permease protein [Oceanotoga teriensis]|jgi:peptide/nickel transport system permease protein|uniref:Peptide/nickel transport system permease protein n=1 Tax=Oceanotoga teriensis TaxID=515440 RepID=A0AA45HJB9_9BACT|nr:ABC transporter permease [Oceanotoga teriensis]PWJ95899.1 peptide/nickel transport system permease protein [Oceanotoga teriensis]
MSFIEKIKKNDNLYFALRNKKVIIGISIFLFLLIVAIFGPLIAPYDYEEFAGQPYLSPSLEHFMGTSIFGRDIFSQVIYGLRSTFVVGFIGGTIGTIIGLIIGFFAGYKSGSFLDELLMMMTNMLLVIPTIALLIILSAYLPYRGVITQSMIIGFTSWPWVARAVRSQTLSLRNKEFVNLSRISGASSFKIIKDDIAYNMFSYVFMVYILQFAGAILTSVSLDFIGLGPTRGISLGLIMQNAVNWNAIQLGLWWWAILPGVILTVLVTSLYFINTGLDEVFNPTLREM